MKKTTKTEYFYNDDNELSRVVTTETSNCPDCDGCEDEELLTSEVEFIDDGAAIASAALALATVGLCLTAITSIFRHK